MVASDPDRVQRRGEDARKGEDNAQSRGGLDLGISGRERIVIRHHADASASRDESQDGILR